MNRQEAASVVAYLNRAGLLGAMEGQAAVWADALDDTSYVTAQVVVRDMAKRRTSDQRWVTPGDVAASVRAERAANHAASPRRLEPPESIESAADQIAWIRAFERLIGDGLTPEAADEQASTEVGCAPRQLDAQPRPVPALVAQTVRDMPNVPRSAA